MGACGQGGQLLTVDSWGRGSSCLQWVHEGRVQLHTCTWGRGAATYSGHMGGGGPAAYRGYMWAGDPAAHSGYMRAGGRGGWVYGGSGGCMGAGSPAAYMYMKARAYSRHVGEEVQLLTVGTWGRRSSCL